MPTVTLKTQPIYGLPLGTAAGRKWAVYQQQIIACQPLLYYPLDDLSSGSCREYLGRDVLGSGGAVAHAALVSGSRGAVATNGSTHLQSSTVISVPATYSIGVIAQSVSIGPSGNSLFGCYTGSAGQMLYEYPSGTGYYFQRGSTSISGAVPASGPNLWIGTYDGTTSVLYVNATQVASSALASPTSGQPWGIGYFGPNNAGTIYASDAFVLPIALTLAQVQSLYHAAFG